MNILHISDFHYCEENLVYERVISAIIDAIKKEGIRVDCVIFTGDLVYYGNRVNDFNKAKDVLFERLINELNIPRNGVIICPGNHDIDRSKIYPTAENSFKTLYNTNYSINKLYADKDKSFQDSLLPSVNYISFEKGFYGESANDQLKQLYSIHFRTIQGVDYGFVCINSSWISALDGKGNNDRGNLLFPPDALKEAIRYIKQKKCRKVLLTHHPLHFFKDYNASEIESLVFNNFDLMFSGHVHKAHSNTGHDGTNGLYAHVAKASLSHDESCQGCSIVSLHDYEDNEVRVCELTYISDSDECHCGTPIVHIIPSGEEKIKAIKFRNTIASKYSLELDYAQKLLLLNNDGEASEFLSLFSFPQLRTRSDDSIGGQDVSDILSEDDIFANKDNYLFLGRDKCGKTTLLRWIQVSFLKNFSRYQVIPLYINCKELEAKLDSSFDIIDEIRSYYGVNTNKAKELLESGSFVFLLDNYACNTASAGFFKDFFDLNPYCRFIICSEYIASRPISSYNISKQSFKGYFFQDLTRVEIVKYVEKRITRPEEQEVVKEQIVRLCKQMQLPVNYWTVSLLLLIHKRSTGNYSQNIFEVLDVCVDEIFGKKERALKGADISFDKLKKICAYLAMRLFKDFESNVYSASKSEIVGILSSFIEEDDRISVSPNDIFNFFQQSGILKLKDLETEVYVFRHNGFFEYFLALQMTEDKEFKELIMNNPNLYLAFKNEWDIYSGIRRNDGDFLGEIDSITSKMVGPILNIQPALFDEALVKKGQAYSYLEEKSKGIIANSPLSSSDKAAIEDSIDVLSLEADVKPIENYLNAGLTPDAVERCLFILGRVYRNSDGIPSKYKELKKNVFERIINYYSNFAFFSIDYVARQASSAIKEAGFDFSESQEKVILKIITDFSPLVAQVSLTDSIGHKSVATLFKKRYTEIEPEIDTNQYLAFILVFVLADIDLDSNIELIKAVMPRITIPILKTMVYFKLNYYMAFRAGRRESIQHRLSGMIKDQRHNMDVSIKDRSQQKFLNESKKRSDTQAHKGSL